MKTKISHLGRSTVSVILAVMMLLSTMLIGTVSTVNAVTKTFEAVNLVGNINGNTKWDSTKYPFTFDETTGYWYLDITITQSSEFKARVNKDWVISFGASGGGNYIISEIGDYRISVKDGAENGTELTVQKTVKKVADSVTLTANPTSVKVGNSVTLTPTVSGAKSDNLTYTYKKTSDGTATEEKNADNSLTVTPTVAGTYKYTVTVSADGCSPVTSNEVSFTVTDSVKYYIGGRFKGESWNPNRTDMQFVKVDGESNLYKYETNMTVSQLSQNVDNAKQYFFIHTGNGNEKVYYASSDRLGHTFHKNSINNQLTLKYYPTKADDEKNYIKFDDVADSSSNVVLYLDTSDKDNLKLYYSADIEPDYRITGNLSAIGEWNGYDSALKFDTAESDGSYSKVITVTDDDVNNKFFKLIKSENGSDKYYGPNDSTYDIISSNSSVTAYDTFEGSGEGNDFYFSKAGTYKIHYIVKTGKNTPSVWVEENTTKYNVTVAENIKSIASVDKTEAAKGEKVTVTATPETGKVLDTVTVVGENGSTPIETTVSGNTATFTMPDQDVTVTNVTFRTANTYTVKFSSSDNTFGTVSAKHNGADFNSGTTVTEGDEVTFTATQNPGYTFTGWTVNDASVPSTTNPYKITVNKDTTVVANFKEMTGTLSDYYLLCGTDATFKPGSYTPVRLYKNEEGVYYADFDAANIPKKQDYYIIFSQKEDTSGIIIDSSENIKITTVSDKGFSLDKFNENVQKPGSGSNNVRFAKVYINGDSDVVSFTIKVTDLNLNSKKITYSAEPKFKEPVKNAVNIIAKNGTQTEKFQNMGSTVITPVENAVFDIVNYNDYTQKATAIKGSKVTVTTTVADDYKETYYVKGFVVNGESYGIQSGPNDDGVYTLEYQIPDDVDDNTNFEITPVYFLKDSSNCVTFYVEGFDGAVQDSWGNTIACYPYYEGVSDTNQNAFGAYPGQPLLYEGGKYYTQIPKSITLDGTTDKKIVGMTLNNFALESVHGAISTIKENKQSYDYDDFVRIANNDYGNNIIYTFKYSTVKDNFGELTESPDTITKEDFDSDSGTGNGWEDLTDYNHRKVDLFGNVLTGEDSNKVPLLVVSNGYFENYQGFYATEWTVYELKDGTYSKIAQIPSSALLLRSKDDLTDSTSDTKYKNSLSDYAGAYAKLEAYKNTPALITFESSIKRGYSLQGGTNGGQGGELAERVDGRWYYSMIGEEITAKIAVEYGDTATSTFTNDPFADGTNKTTTIGAQAYFTNEDAFGKTTYKSHIDSSKYFTFTADTIATDKDGQNYVFLGWYLLSDNKYTKLTDAKAPMTGSDTFVARYVKAPKGTVTIDHRLFSAASNPTPTQNVGTGSGKCYVTVRVLDKDDTVIKKFDETEGSVTLDGTYIDSTKDYKLEITLKTVTSGQDKFQQFYYLKQDKKSYVPIDSSTTTTEGKVTTVTRKVDILKNFFKLNDDGTYTFKNETGSDSIHYYSDIEETKIPYKITFNYEPRLESDAKQYVVKGEFTSEYILKHGAELTEEFVMSVAPYEDNFFNTIKWDSSKIIFDNSGEIKTAVVNSTTSSRTVTVKALDAEGKPIKAYELNGSEFTSTVVYGSLLTYDNLCGLDDAQKEEIANGNKYIYVAEPEYNGKKFSYWQISTSSDMNDKSAYVTKCFSQEFNYIAYNHYYIWPVYGESQSITGASTTLNFLDYSRNQSTGLEGENKTDRVFADFALAFDSNGIQLKTYNGTNIKVGMFLEVCGDLKSDSTGNVITNIDQYKNMPEYSTSDADLDSIKAAVLGNSEKKNFTYTTADGKERKLLNKPIDINSLDNKNRIEYYVGYNNNLNNQKKLMRAYSYVIVDNEITLCSTPYSFVNYYNVGNMTYTVS